MAIIFILCEPEAYSREAQKIKIRFAITLPEQNIGVPKYHGIGHVVFRSNRKYTSVQLCLDCLQIDQTAGIATYSGYLEKDFAQIVR
jgi:hypothetical protein